MLLSFIAHNFTQAQYFCSFDVHIEIEFAHSKLSTAVNSLHIFQTTKISKLRRSHFHTIFIIYYIVLVDLQTKIPFLWSVFMGTLIQNTIIGFFHAISLIKILIQTKRPNIQTPFLLTVHIEISMRSLLRWHFILN